MIKGLSKWILIKYIIYAVILSALLFALNSFHIFAEPQEIKLIDRTDHNLKHIGIEWSDTCLTLIKAGDLETCGNPDLIKSAYPQAPLKSTYQTMFDEMEKTPKADYQKKSIYENHLTSCIIDNYCNVFNSKLSIHYWYEIPDKSRSYMDKIITINAHMLHKNLNTDNDEVFIYNNTRALILDTNQINIKRCNEIAYTPEPYRMFREMGLIVWHILDDCKDPKKLGFLNAPYMEELELTVIPINESPAWLELKRMEGLKTKYKQNMLGKD